MAYTPREIKDRIAVGDDIFQVEDLGNNRIRLIPAPTQVLEPGTPINKALLQPIEDELGALSQKVDTLWENWVLEKVKTGTLTIEAGDIGIQTVLDVPRGTQLICLYNANHDIIYTFLDHPTHGFRLRFLIPDREPIESDIVINYTVCRLV
jgi:hypothetical protein